MGQHGPQCICEICTCGRHACPFDRSKTASTNAAQALTAANGEGQHFYRKEFATIADGAQRSRPARPPPGELSLDTTPLDIQRRGGDNELRPALANDARNERFVTSAALRKRAQNSQINLGSGSQQAMRSTYRDESERALQNGGSFERTRATRPAGGTALFASNHPETPKTTSHRSEFGAKRAERAQPTRPRTSDLWKREGTIQGTTTTREQFAPGRRSERAEPFRPRENEPILGGGDRSFQRETSNLTEFGPKRGERAAAIRPAGSDLFRSGEPMLERATVNRSEYGREGRGERAPRRVPVEEGAKLLRGDGSFLSETSKSAEFQPKRGDRFEARVQGASDIWKSGDRLEGRGVNREEYGREGRGDRFPASRPKESGILKGEGSFTSETHKRVEFGPKRGERSETVRPADSDILRGEGRFEAESVARSEFDAKGPGDRFPARKPGTDEVWRREGRMAEGGTVNRVEYTIEGKRGERHEVQRPRQEPLFDPDFDNGQPLSTVHRSEFVQHQAERAQRHVPAGSDVFKSGEPLLERATVNRSEYGREGRGDRFERRVPVEEGADLLRGDGTFVGETSKSAEFQPKRGDRFEARVQGASDIWKTEGKIEGRSVHREHFPGHASGERAEARRPQESGILKGEGSFTTETHKRAEFGPKKGERAEAVRPTDSDLFRGEGPMAEAGSINRTDYAHTRGERAERVALKDSGILMPPEGAQFAQSTVNRDEYSEKQHERVQPHRPAQSWHFEEGGHPSGFGASVTHEDFVEKRLEDGERVRQHGRANESSFGLLDGSEVGEFGRTLTQDEFAAKELAERMRPVQHMSELSISNPEASFHSTTMYSDNFQPISPGSHRSRSVRPSTALKLGGERELNTGYALDYTNKLMPCPAGELTESLRNHACKVEENGKQHPHTQNFEFHSVNKGHHLYRSRENLAEA